MVSLEGVGLVIGNVLCEPRNRKPANDVKTTDNRRDVLAYF